MPDTVKQYININPRHLGLMGQRLQEREDTVTPLENPDLEPVPIQSHYQVNPSYWGNTTVNGEPVDITGYRDSNTGIARYQDGEYGYVNLPDNYGEWMMDGVTIYPERPRLKGVVRNYFDDAQQSKILGQPNVIAPIGVGDSEIQPIQFPTKTPEKYHGQDLDRFFANLLTFGTAGTEEHASQLFKEGDYLKGSIYAGLPLLVKGGPSGNLLRAGFWGYNLYNDADDSIKMVQDRNGWGFGKDVAKMFLDTGALFYDWTKGLLDAQPYLQNIARQRNNMGYWVRTASDITHHPLDTYRTIRKGTYVHDSPSLRRAITESKQAVREGADYTRNYYQNALKVDMPEANITAKTNIPGAWGEQIPGTNNFNYTFYRSPLSNLSRNTRDFKRVGGHEYTHLAEDYLNNRYFFPSLNVPAKPYYLPNVNHPIMSTATVDDFMEGNIHGRSPEETWANYMGYNAGGGDPVMPFTNYNIGKEGIAPPRGFISDYENYLKSLSGKALQREGEIQLFNRRYGQKALGGTITNNSDSTILADNNNYIQGFKGGQYGLPVVRYDEGGRLNIHSIPASQLSVNPITGNSLNPRTGLYDQVLMAADDDEVVVTGQDKSKTKSTRNPFNQPYLPSTGGAGYIPPAPYEEVDVGQRLYDNLYPGSYGQSTLDNLKRLAKAIVSNEKDERVTKVGYNPDRDALWAEYLQIPEEQRHQEAKRKPLHLSPYSPTLGRSGNKYYGLPLSSQEKDALYEDAFSRGDFIYEKTPQLEIGENKLSRTLGALGTHTLGRGYDDKGDYISYYDLWDINPFGNHTGDGSMGFGHPVPIYDRMYLDDYFGIPTPTHASYLPGITVTGDSH